MEYFLIFQSPKAQEFKTCNKNKKNIKKNDKSDKLLCYGSALKCPNKEIDRKIIKSLNEIVVNGLTPDLTLLFDVLKLTI